MAANDNIFSEAAQYWDLDSLYTDLAEAKGKSLTPMEKVHLRGLLCGLSPAEIADKLGKNSNGVETDLCATIYKYVKTFLDKTECKISNFRTVCDWLIDAGYKCQTPQIPVNQLLPEKSVIQVTNINYKKNEVVFFINLKIPTTEEVTENYIEENLPMNFNKSDFN
jgi:hypothetical protein